MKKKGQYRALAFRSTPEFSVEDRRQKEDQKKSRRKEEVLQVNNLQKSMKEKADFLNSFSLENTSVTLYSELQGAINKS